MDETGGAVRATAPVRPGAPAAERHWWAGHEDALPEALEWLSPRP